MRRPFPIPSCFQLLLFSLTLAVVTPAAERIEAPHVLTGRSRQMIVVGYNPGSPWGPPSFSEIRSNSMQMIPAVALLSAERIKEELLKQLGREDSWRGTISVIIRGKVSPDDEILIRSEFGRGGWKFKVHTPGQVKRLRYLRAIVRALLLEIANRQNTTRRLAEVPLWLQEGMAAHLFSRAGPALVLENRTQIDYTHDHLAGLGELRQHFRVMSPLTFENLSLPQGKFLKGMGWETFQRSAHLFVMELLRLPEGRSGLFHTLELMPAFLNQQLAFRKAFEKRFRTALDLEKWWAVNVVSFIGREKNLRWGESKSLERLQQIFSKPVQVRTDTNTAPTTKSMGLQDLIESTRFADHRAILINTINQLTIVQANSQSDLARLIGDYRDALMKYLTQRSKVRTTDRSRASSGGTLARKTAIKQFDLLDDIRKDFTDLAKPVEKEDSVEAAERLLNRQ
jgi:hypothetical protein